MTTLAIVDIAILILIAVSMLIGAWRGFVKEAFSFVNWGAALLISFIFRGSLASSDIFLNLSPSPVVRDLAAGAAIFFTVLIAGSIAVNLLSKIVKATGLGGTDRLIGALFGIGRAFVILMLIVIFLPRMLPVAEESWWKASYALPELQRFESWFLQLISDIWVWIQTLLA